MSSHTFTLRHIPARKNVLLISCMDLRLIDNLVEFMHVDNLTNRYDQYIMAGVGLTATHNPQWLEALWVHLNFAYIKHDVRDVYIVEHRDCGAYKAFAHLEYKDSEKDQEKEWKDHYTHAKKLKQVIEAEAAKNEENRNWKDLRVQCFMMDLRGGVKLLDSAKEKKD